MSSSLPALPSTTSNQCCDFMEITDPPTVQVESGGKREPNSDAPNGTRRNGHIIFRMASQGLRIRNKMSEEMARSELETMERDARHSVKLSNSKIAV